jgi:hypothetical protein
MGDKVNESRVNGPAPRRSGGSGIEETTALSAAAASMLERQRPAAASGRAAFSRLDERDHRTAHTDLAGATPEIGQGDYVAARTNSRARAFSRNAMSS